MKDSRQGALDRHAEAHTEPTAIPAGAEEVEAGIYVERVADLSARLSRWKADFYLWFHWREGGPDPGENFHVVDGHILEKRLIESREAGGRRYALYLVSAEFTKAFDVSRFPRDDHVLTIRIEDARHDRSRLVYVPDGESSAVSSRVAMPGYTIYDRTLNVRDHSYRTTLGGREETGGAGLWRSQLQYGIWVARPGWALYAKMFLGTFVAVGVGLLCFLVSPGQSSPRFSIPVGSLFASVAANYVLNQHIPESDLTTLADLVVTSALAAIFLAILTSTWSLACYSRYPADKDAIHRFDHAALAVLTVCFLLVNLLFANAASL